MGNRAVGSFSSSSTALNEDIQDDSEVNSPVPAPQLHPYQQDMFPTVPIVPGSYPRRRAIIRPLTLTQQVSLETRRVNALDTDNGSGWLGSDQFQTQMRTPSRGAGGHLTAEQYFPVHGITRPDNNFGALQDGLYIAYTVLELARQLVLCRELLVLSPTSSSVKIVAGRRTDELSSKGTSFSTRPTVPNFTAVGKGGTIPSAVGISSSNSSSSSSTSISGSSISGRVAQYNFVTPGVNSFALQRGLEGHSTTNNMETSRCAESNSTTRRLTDVLTPMTPIRPPTPSKESRSPSPSLSLQGPVDLPTSAAAAVRPSRHESSKSESSQQIQMSAPSSSKPLSRPSTSTATATKSSTEFSTDLPSESTKFSSSPPSQPITHSVGIPINERGGSEGGSIKAGESDGKNTSSSTSSDANIRSSNRLAHGEDKKEPENREQAEIQNKPLSRSESRDGQPRVGEDEIAAVGLLESVQLSVAAQAVDAPNQQPNTHAGAVTEAEVEVVEELHPLDVFLDEISEAESREAQCRRALELLSFRQTGIFTDGRYLIPSKVTYRTVMKPITSS